MKVLFDAYWWVRGPGANRTVLRELISHWCARYPDDEVVLAVRHADRARADVPEGVRVDSLRGWPHGAACIAELPLLQRRHRPDWTITHNYTPVTGRTAVFVHDLMFQERREWFTRAELAYFTPMPISGRRADVVLTSTATEAARMERLNPSLRPVTPIGLAVPSALVTATPVRPSAAPDGGFAVVVGRLNVRKNLARVISAAHRSRGIDPDHPLLVVGDSQHSGVSTEHSAEIDAAVAAGSVVFTGRVTDAELRWLYEHATYAVCLSIDEGFGLPPLEALSFGSPVLVSDIAVFREVVGDAGTFVDPLDTAAIVSAMDVLREATRRRPDDRGYSWDASVTALRGALMAETR